MPEGSWNSSVANLSFDQTAFHALFYTDIYLGRTLSELKEQPFHQENAAHFGDYEELEDRPQELHYGRPFVLDYFQHCRVKAKRCVESETEASLQVDPGFDWLPFSRAEAHVYNIRHIHHHAAQLSLRLRLDHGEAAPWVGSGWRARK